MVTAGVGGGEGPTGAAPSLWPRMAKYKMAGGGHAVVPAGKRGDVGPGWFHGLLHEAVPVRKEINASFAQRKALPHRNNAPGGQLLRHIPIYRGRSAHHKFPLHRM